MNNLIGIAGVFVLTFFLIALYHLMSAFGRHRKRYDAQTKRPKDPEHDRQPDHNPRRTSGKNDDWLLWSPQLNEPAGPSKPGSRDHHNKESGLRS